MSEPIQGELLKSWNTATPDWAERIMAGKSLVPDLPLFDAVAEKALRIFKRLRAPDVFGTPTYGEICGEWVFDFVRVVFGSYDPDLRRRMIREFFLLVPKKNGKSSIAAAIIVTAAIMNERPDAELLLIAPTKEIASISFRQAHGIVKLDAELTKIFHVQTHLKIMTHRLTGAAIVVKAADADVITGSKATFILIDETHVFAAKPKAAEIFLEIRGSLAARPDGFLLQISTQSKTPPSGVFKKELTKARDVRNGDVELPVLPVLYELPIEVSKDGGWKDPETWLLINPNLDRSVDSKYLADELLTAERDGPDSLALLASQHFNVEIGMALLHDRWVGAEIWPEAEDPKITLDELMETSDCCIVGIDGGGMDDLLGLSVIGRHKTTRIWRLWVRAWAHPIVLQRRKSIAPRLQDFANDGDLVICKHPTEDTENIAEICLALDDAGLLPEEKAIGLDVAGVDALVDALTDAGISREKTVGVSQGYLLNGTIKGTERRLYNGTLKHARQPLMDWCVANAKVEPKGNAVVVTKAVSGTGKIDPLMASFNAIQLMSWNPTASGSSYLNLGELVVL